MIQQHVTSVELSKRLKELGVPQESSFWWTAPESFDRPKVFYGHRDSAFAFNNHGELYAAFLASELLDLLPAGFGVQKHEDGYAAFDIEGRLDKKRTQATTPANALGKALAHLIEQGVVDPKELHAS